MCLNKSVKQSVTPIHVCQIFVSITNSLSGQDSLICIICNQSPGLQPATLPATCFEKRSRRYFATGCKWPSQLHICNPFEKRTPGMSMDSVCNGYILFLSLDAQKTSWPIPLKHKTSILQKKSNSKLKPIPPDTVTTNECSDSDTFRNENTERDLYTFACFPIVL